MKKLSMFGIAGGAALLAAVPFSLQWSEENPSARSPGLSSSLQTCLLWISVFLWGIFHIFLWRIFPVFLWRILSLLLWRLWSGLWRLWSGLWNGLWRLWWIWRILSSILFRQVLILSSALWVC